MTCYIYYLQFDAPFHIDAQGNHFYTQASQWIHSDTLSSAIAINWAKLYGDWPFDTHESSIDLPYQVSSCFPFVYHEQKPLSFLPKPKISDSLAFSQNKAENLRLAKQFKKIQWVDIDYWQALTSGRWLSDLASDLTESSKCYQGFLSRQSVFTCQPVLTESVATRTATSRIDNQAKEGQLFDFSQIFMNDQAGLYCLAQFNDDQAKAKFESALALLGDEGLGADRAVGRGLFSVANPRGTICSFYQSPQTGYPAALLSLANPKDSECDINLLGQQANYELTSRGGWISGSGLRKNRVRAFSEASILDQPFKGRIVDLTPTSNQHNHPVYRDLRAFCMGVTHNA